MAARYTGTYFPLIISLQLWRSEPPSSYSPTFIATVSSQLNVQSHPLFSFTTFRVVSAVWHSELQFVFSLAFRATSFPQFGVQSHRIFLVWCSVSLFHLSVHSCCVSLAFRATISFSVWHSKPPFSLQFGVQSHYLFSVLAFRATISSQFRHSEPPSLLSLGVQSHHLFSVWRLETSFLFSLVFRAAISSQLRCSELSFTVWCSKPLSLLNLGV